MTARRMDTAELRRLCRWWSAAKLRRWIADTRRTMRGPVYVSPNIVGGRHGPDIVFCARAIAVFRAALRYASE